MEICEIWSIAPERIGAFLRSIGGLRREGEDVYVFEGCEVRLTRLADRTLGRVSLPRTELRFSGEEEATRRIYRAFFLNFLSEGG